MGYFKKLAGAAVIVALLASEGILGAQPFSSEKKSADIKNSTHKKIVTLNWYLHSNWYDKRWDSQKTLFDKVVTEKTGVQLNLIMPVNTGDEKLLEIAESGNLPDLMTIDNWNTTRAQMIKAHYFQPLNKLLPKVAPEFLKIIPNSMKRWFTEKDGNWYAISDYFTAPEWLSKGEHIINPNGMIARKDIMDKLKIKPQDFLTEASTINALIKVRDSHLSYNGKKIVPFVVHWDGWEMSRLWGIPWEKKDGKWQDFRIHPKYLEMFKFLNKLWREGLLSADNLTVWPGDMIERGVCFAYIGNLDTVKDYMERLYNHNMAAYYEAVGPIHALDGAQPLYDISGTGWMSTFITKSCKHPKEAAKLLEFLSSKEGQMLTWFGVKGKTYTEVNGKAKYAEDYLAAKLANSASANKVYGISDFWPMMQTVFYYKNVDRQSLPFFERNYINMVDFFSKYSTYTPETMGVEPEQGTIEAGIARKIKDYWAKQIRNMVLAKSSQEVENVFNDSIKYINSIGYQKYYNASNTVFQEQKKKMGVWKSYPGVKR